MTQKCFLIFLLFLAFIIQNNVLCQTEKYTASQFAVHILSSANFMGYLEPCG